MIALPDHWFSLDIIAAGNRLIVKVDGKTTAEVVDRNHVPASEHIALMQNAFSKFECRRIEIKELKPDAAPPVVVAKPIELKTKNGNASAVSFLAQNDPPFQDKKISKSFLMLMEAGGWTKAPIAAEDLLDVAL